jgi:hypothetical protein
MRCHEIESEIVDIARGVPGDPVRQAAISRHVHSCSRCSRRLETERALSAALRRLADGTAEPPFDPDREAAILTAFDAVWEPAKTGRSGTRRTRAVRGWLVAAAVLLAVGAARLWTLSTPPTLSKMTGRISSSHQGARPPTTVAPKHVASMPPQSLVAQNEATGTVAPSARRKNASRSVPTVTTRPPAEFVQVPGAGTLPPLESGELLRLSLPVSALPSLGLLPPASAEVDVVSADVLVGQDGFARAVRLVP